MLTARAPVALAQAEPLSDPTLNGWAVLAFISIILLAGLLAQTSRRRMR